MTHDRKATSVTQLAQDALSALFEARIAADFYDAKPDDRGRYVQRFIESMYQVEAAIDGLEGITDSAFDKFRAVANADSEFASAHDYVLFAGGFTVSFVGYAMLKAWAAETGESLPEGEFRAPKLCYKTDFRKYADAAIQAFFRHGPTHDELNRYVAWLQREAATASGQTDTKTDTKRNPLPKNRDVLKLAQKINRELCNGGTQRDIALGFTGGDEKKAQTLLRALRRYPSLLK